MADNVAITQGSGTTVRTDELAGGIQVQVVKIALGADGAEDNLVDAGQQLMAASVPVAIASNQSAIPVTDNSTTLSIDDGGGAITVDGTVAVTNAGITTIAGAVAGTEMQVDVLTMPTVTVNAHAVTNAGTFAVQVDGAALTALQLIDNMISGSEAQVDVITLPAIPAGTNNIGDVDVLTIAAGDNNIGNVDIASAIPAGSNLIGKTAPLDAILEGGLTELVGINEQVDQNDYSGSVGVALAGTYSGEILSVAFYATEDGTGAVQDSAGILYVFDADPTISSGDTSMTAAERVTIIGKIAIGANDWDVDANGGLAYITTQPIPFHSLANLYFVWKHLDATALNDAAGDDEQLEFNFWYRRES
jgi:hypothetical protein